MDLTYKESPLFEKLIKESRQITDAVDSFFDQDDYKDCAFYQYRKAQSRNPSNPFTANAVWISCNCKRCAVWC